MVKQLAFVLYFVSMLAQAHQDSNFHFSTFGTLGLTLSDSDNYGYRREIAADSGVYDGDFDFASRSLLGFQLDAPITSELDFVAQAVFKEVPDPSLDSYLSMAFLRYSPNPQWDIRLGRIPPDLFLITEYQDVDFAYNWAVVPQEVYSILPYRSIDGGDVNFTRRLLNGAFNLRLFAGISEIDISTEAITEHLSLEDILGFSLSFERDNWLLQVRHTQITIAEESLSTSELMKNLNQMPASVWPQASEFVQSMSLKGESIAYSSVGGQAYWGNWLFTGELVRINADTIIVPQINSGYVSAAYQANAHTFYGLVAGTNSDNYSFNDPNVQQQVPGVQELVLGINAVNNLYASNQKSWSLGWRYEVNENIASSLQWSQFDIDEAGGTLWRTASYMQAQETVNVIFANISFVW